MGAAARPPRPKLGRLVLAFLLAPVASWLAFHFGMVSIAALVRPADVPVESVMPAIYLLSAAALAYGFCVSILLGVPLYVALRGRLRLSLPRVALLGGVLALLPALILTFSYAEPLGIGPSMSDPLTIAGIFACGVVGGVAFWLLAVWRDPALGPAARP